MVPLSAHEAIVASYEQQFKASLEQAAALSAAGLRAVADDFFSHQKVAQARLKAKEEDLSRASAELRDLSGSLLGLKKDARTLREALIRYTLSVFRFRKFFTRCLLASLILFWLCVCRFHLESFKRGTKNRMVSGFAIVVQSVLRFPSTVGVKIIR